MSKISQTQIPAKLCFSHLGGKLGTLLMEQLIKKGWFAKHTAADRHYHVTATGRKELQKLGVDLSQVPVEV